jgi:hypothetical protein
MNQLQTAFSPVLKTVGIISFLAGLFYLLFLLNNFFKITIKIQSCFSDTFLEKAYRWLERASIFLFAYFVKITQRFLDNTFTAWFATAFYNSIDFFKQLTNSGSGSGVITVLSGCLLFLGLLTIIYSILVLIDFSFSLYYSDLSILSSFNLSIEKAFLTIFNFLTLLGGTVYFYIEQTIYSIGYVFK